jgi:hypothetical protein
MVPRKVFDEIVDVLRECAGAQKELHNAKKCDPYQHRHLQTAHSFPNGKFVRGLGEMMGWL